MNTTNDNISFNGKKLTILGAALKVGQQMPAFKLTANDFSDLESTDLKQAIVIFSVVPSLDTPTCAVQTKRFNDACSKVSREVLVLTVSMDLPFAQQRWCGAEGCQRVVTASDFKYRSFGKAFGVQIEELGILTRAVFIAGKDRLIEHVEYVGDLSKQPSYEAALGKVQALSRVQNLV